MVAVVSIPTVHLRIHTAPDNASQVDLYITSREACRDRASPPQVPMASPTSASSRLRPPMRTKCEHRVNGKVHGSEPLADFVQPFMWPTEPLKLRRGCSRKSDTSHSPSRRELDPRASGAPLIGAPTA